MSDVDVIIVGGGIGGLSAATALTRKGVKVRLYERSSEFGEVGAGLQIAPNCTRILDDYGLLDEAKSLGVLPESMIMKDATDGSRAHPARPARPREEVRLPVHGHPSQRPARDLLRSCQRLGIELVTDKQCIRVRAGRRQGDRGVLRRHH